MAKPGSRPPIERMLVEIDTVDTANRLAHVTTQRGGKIKVGFRATSALFQIPKQGERWIIERHTAWEWQFVHRQDKLDEHDSKSELEEGDGHLRVSTGQALLVEASQIVLRDPENKDGEDAAIGIPGDLLVEANSLHVRKVGESGTPIPWGGMRMERKHTTGITASWALGHPPVSDQALMLFDEGELIDPNDWSLSGSTITFSPSIANNSTLVAYYQTLY